jgi:hypothetical protein
MVVFDHIFEAKYTIKKVMEKSNNFNSQLLWTCHFYIFQKEVNDLKKKRNWMNGWIDRQVEWQAGRKVVCDKMR